MIISIYVSTRYPPNSTVIVAITPTNHLKRISKYPQGERVTAFLKMPLFPKKAD